jgi:hypothetical protein
MLKKIFIVGFAVAQIFSASLIFAGEVGQYQIFASGEENAYLVDTTTGFVWILSYRTLPTGREPVAIPYKFIGITPKNQGNFISENTPGVVGLPHVQK